MNFVAVIKGDDEDLKFKFFSEKQCDSFISDIQERHPGISYHKTVEG